MSETTPHERTNLLGLTRSGLEAFVVAMGEKPFRARQLYKWIYKRAVGDFDAMTDLRKDFRRRLAEVAELRTPEILGTQVSADGTRKWVLRFEGGQAIEAVFIPEPGRGTLCISSQVGCQMDCGFCATGAQGFNRNLSTAEIVGQVWLANRELGYSPDGDRVITNVVFMGMGEPFLNYENVRGAILLLNDPDGLGLGQRRISVSTSGIVPGIERFTQEQWQVNLAVSLHAPTDTLRSQLMPINRTYPLGTLMPALDHYVAVTNRRLMLEYLLLGGVNDGPDDARQLADLVRAWPNVSRLGLVNLLTYNPTRDAYGHWDAFKGPSERTLATFEDALTGRGIPWTRRVSFGTDIGGACGQLAGESASPRNTRL